MSSSKTELFSRPICSLHSTHSCWARGISAAPRHQRLCFLRGTRLMWARKHVVTLTCHGITRPRGSESDFDFLLHVPECYVMLLYYSIMWWTRLQLVHESVLELLDCALDQFYSQWSCGMQLLMWRMGQVATMLTAPIVCSESLPAL